MARCEPKHERRARRTVIVALMALASTCILDTARGRHAHAEGCPKHFRLVCVFEQGLHAARGAVNPFSASGGVKVVQVGGDRGGVARFEGHDPTPEGNRRSWEKSALIFDGKNVPGVGTLGLRIRWPGKRHWADNARTWLAVLVPRVGYGRESLGEQGTGLALLKDKDNALVLGAYQFQDGRLDHYFRSRKSGMEVAEPDAAPLRIDVGKLSRGEWTSVRMAWDCRAGRVWLGVDGRVESAQFKLRPSAFLCLLIGTPPNIGYTEQRGFDGEIDDLVVDARTPADAPNAGLEIPAALPAMAAADTAMEKAVHLPNDPWAAKWEATLRTHLKRVLEAQQSGGWAYSVAFPSMLRFLSSKVVIPYRDECVACSKEQNSAGAAVRLLGAYEALGDAAYLQGAEKTAKMLLTLQQPAGNWVYSAWIEPDTGKVLHILRADLAPFEDHVQSHPVLLMWRLHQITGKPEYEQAAARGVEFILKGQNPNGSWSHHYTLKLKCGQAARGYRNAGEINDYATTDQMMVMLAAYRRTGESRYLASYLRAGDWLVSAFIDKKAKGWAQQYDEQNQPIQARHFEPAAVSLSEGISAAPTALMAAYRLTGDRRYLAPLEKWKRWMLENRIVTDKDKKRGGWHAYYEIETGQAIRMVKRKVLPADPRDVRDGGFSSILKKLDRIHTPDAAYVPAEASGRAALTLGRNYMDFFVNDFDKSVGSWAFDHGPNGKCFSPQTVRVLFLCWAVYLSRQLRGQIPWDHRMSSLTMHDWVNLFCHVIPPGELRRPLSKEELASARALIPER